MIHYIKGKLTMKLETGIVLETGGIGFEINTPSNSRFYLADIGEELTAYTATTVREDDMSLYGFDDSAGLELFNKLITVNGVGAKAALAILSSMPPSGLKKAIVFEDTAMLTRANGVGKKTAQRIVLDLKDKLDEIRPKDGIEAGDIAEPGGDQSEKGQAVDGLIALGYSRSEAAGALLGAEEGLSTEEYIKTALKNI
ncbi:MAG: Holliday junction branch migration protein RuvA [Eubacteriaceae bacterium]|nr:Holliday junction branch migration protein RuvA [Eubacteriaceae bacterium]